MELKWICTANNRSRLSFGPVHTVEAIFLPHSCSFSYLSPKDALITCRQNDIGKDRPSCAYYWAWRGQEILRGGKGEKESHRNLRVGSFIIAFRYPVCASVSCFLITRIQSRGEEQRYMYYISDAYGIRTLGERWKGFTSVHYYCWWLKWEKVSFTNFYVLPWFSQTLMPLMDVKNGVLLLRHNKRIHGPWGWKKKIPRDR